MNHRHGFEDGRPPGQVVRCAIYTRKSSEEGLDMAFNSLDAQREAGLDYIKSQKHQGWIAIPTLYDDGGYSGGNTERPGLKKLLDDIQRGKVDIVLTYKVDRLSRSLADFARLMQVFDEHEVSFVSVTQSFNTSSSMGRLTLNMLLSFAQFEREVTGERIRDKILATKKKGVWVVGQPPLGYRLPSRELGDADPEIRVLRIVEEEAKVVRAIYDGYLKCGSLVKLSKDLTAQGYTTKRWISRPGKEHGGRRLDASFIYRVLTNALYTGMITHTRRSSKSASTTDVYPGLHEPIIDRKVFDQVQEKMAKAERETRHKWTHTHLLKGKIRTFEGFAMSPGSVQRPRSKKKAAGERMDSGRRLVSYYVSQKAIKQGYADCPIKTINSEYIDALVRALVLKHLKATTKRDLEKLAGPDRDYWVREVIGLVELGKEQLVIDLDHERVNACMAAMDNNATTPKRSREAEPPEDESIVAGCAYTPEVEEGEGRTRLRLSVKWRKWNGRLALTSPEGGDLLLKMTRRGQVVPNAKIVETIGLAYAWHEELLKTGCQIEEVAEAYGVNEATVRVLLALTHLSPSRIMALLREGTGNGISIDGLAKAGRVVSWQ